MLKNETQLVCIAKFQAREGEAQMLIKSLHSLIRDTLTEAGCIRYELNQNIENQNEVTFIEKWYDQKTFEAHCDTPYVKKFFNDGEPDHVDSFEVSLHKEILPSI